MGAAAVATTGTGGEKSGSSERVVPHVRVERETEERRSFVGLVFSFFHMHALCAFGGEVSFETLDRLVVDGSDRLCQGDPREAVSCDMIGWRRLPTDRLLGPSDPLDVCA